MSRENHNPVIYYFPVNVDDDGGVFKGRIKKRNLIEAVILFAVMLLIWKLFTFPFGLTVKVISFVALEIPTVVFSIIGVKGDSLLEYIETLITFKRRKRMMVYRLPINISEVRQVEEPENKHQDLSRKEKKVIKKEKKKQEKLEKKLEKKQRKSKR